MPAKSSDSFLESEDDRIIDGDDEEEDDDLDRAETEDIC